MKLNHDCVRSVLLYLEETLTDKPLKIRHFSSTELDKFTLEDIVYSCQKLNEAKFITVSTDPNCNKHSSIKSITWKGHNFLDNIRDTKVLSIAKKSLSSVASFSLEVLATVCSNVLTNLTKH